MAPCSAARFDYDLDRMFADLQAKEALNPARRADLKPVEPKRGEPS